MSRIVIALGGNALGNNLTEQMTAVNNTARAISGLIADGHEVVISHGNGPQVGMINSAMAELSLAQPQYPVIPLSVCVAMSQSYIGYDLQNALREELLSRNIPHAVATVITQVVVDLNDEAFLTPTKPIGRYMNKQQADALVAEKGYAMRYSEGKGYRRIVPSPRPKRIVEIETIKNLVNAGQVVIACGGGGIPVITQGHHLKGASAVIDKDFCSALLARELNADMIIILTAVEKVCINYKKENEQSLDTITADYAEKLCAKGHFEAGSMLPKVQAAVEFVKSGKGRTALITLLEKAQEGINGTTGTKIVL